MSHDIPYDALIFLLGGVYYLYVFPGFVRRKMANGRMGDGEGEAWLRRAPRFGYGLILVAIVEAVFALEQKGLFGQHSILGGVVVFFSGAAVLAYALISRRKMDQ